MKIGKVKKFFLMYFYGFINLPYFYKVSKDSPIIIGGCGRSGTTLLLSILAAHPKFHGIEVETGIYATNKLISRSRIKTKIFTSYYLNKGKKKEAIRWIEKTPRNIRNVSLINKYFDNKVQIINIIRDGRDVVTSKHPTKNDDYWVSIDRWVNDVSYGIEYSKLSNVYTVKYEDIINNYKESITKILNFLGEDYVDEMDNYVEHTNVITNSAWNGKVQKIFSSSLKKWKDEKHKERIEQFYSNKKAVKLLTFLGYSINE